MMLNLSKSKRASLKDAIYVPIYLLVIASTIFVAVYVWYSFQTSMTETVNNGVLSGVLSAPSNTTIINAMSDIRGSLQSMDYMFPFIVAGLLMISLIFAFKSGASVLYTFLSIIFWALALLISAILTNIFGQFQMSFPTIATDYPIIVYLMNNMKWIVLAWLALISIVMFTRNKEDDSRIKSMETMYGSGFE